MSEDASPSGASTERSDSLAQNLSSRAGNDGDNANSESDDIDIRARLELLRTENERLREEYIRARRASYRRAAGGLAAIGSMGVVAGGLFPAVRETLFVLGAIGLFGAILTYYLTPERFVTAETGERIYAALAETVSDLTGQLGLQESRVYVPVDGSPAVRLFVPQQGNYVIPSDDALKRPLVVDVEKSARGLSTVPTGARLFTELERSLSGSLAEYPDQVVQQAAESLVETFELADGVTTDVDRAGGRASVDVTGTAYGGPDRFDNPLASLLAVALVRALGCPVEVETTDRSSGLQVTCRWDVEAAETASS